LRNFVDYGIGSCKISHVNSILNPNLERLYTYFQFAMRQERHPYIDKGHKEAKEERNYPKLIDPIRLTIFFSLYLGAFVEKNFDTSLQYWMKARDTVTHLSKKMDYSLAMAVTAMAYHAELWEDNYDR